MKIGKYTIPLIFMILSACTAPLEADYLLTNADVYVGDGSGSIRADIAIKNDEIIFIGKRSGHLRAKSLIDASGYIIAPGFIDPHTHSLLELGSEDKALRQNANYRLQGVTTVFNGNDGRGKPDILKVSSQLQTHGIGTNTALYIGHGAVRRLVMENAKRAPTPDELSQMKTLVDEAMDAGALGLSTGLFYVPGSFSGTDEVVALAKVAALKGGVYDSHIRDESTYNIGLEASIEEVLEIGRRADIPVHIAHIKALGVDVWGKSVPVIAMIEKARAEGLRVTADQYPWLASGTSISAALIPRDIKAGGKEKHQARLKDTLLRAKLRLDVAENLRRRGGGDAVLITMGRADWQGKTLSHLAQKNNLSAVDMAIYIASNGNAKIASFNMDKKDVVNFMKQEWVMTSSDGSVGHPRKYASFPKKYQTYIKDQRVMPVESFLYRSSGLVADTFNLCGRGYLKPGYKADIVVFDPKIFAPLADFQNPERLSEGVKYLFVNGRLAVNEGVSQPVFPGKVLKPCTKHINPE
ncbi:MAG: amidohydrolase family protein [Robiginitomaculum sp.]|nr:amidohydrolase family protein [Robiginitomaculum sp.]